MGGTFRKLKLVLTWPGLFVLTLACFPNCLTLSDLAVNLNRPEPIRPNRTTVK